MSIKGKFIVTVAYGVILMIVVLLIVLLSLAHGADWRLYMENGGMNVTENGISEGHKSYHELGVEGIWETKEWLTMKGGIYGFLRGEPADEDPEIPCGGAGADVEAIFTSGWMNPYLGINYLHITRSSAWKYTNPDDPEYDADYAPQHETEHDMVSARAGFHLSKGWLWADLGTIIPFYTSTKSGNFGPDVGVGVRWKGWDLGYRFKEIRMTDNHLQGGTALSFYWSGVQLGYSF
jgi:hypothetical protein